MIRFDRVSEAVIENLSFRFEAGATAKILSTSEEQKNELYAVFTGLRRPRAGNVFLFDENLYALKEKERLALFQRIGFVPEHGGMISNLKAWENLVLPRWYHRGIPLQETEREVAVLFKQLDLHENGLRQRMGQLPDQLTLYEKRAVALARAMLMDPDVLIYDFIFSGLDRDAARRLMDVMQNYHGGKPGRISVYLCPDDAMSARLSADHTINLTH